MHVTTLFLQAEVAMLTEAGATEYEAGRALWAEKRRSAAAKKFEEAEEKTKTPQAKKFCRALALGAQIEEKLAGNEAVDLAKPEYFPAWFGASGRDLNDLTLKDGVPTLAHRASDIVTNVVLSKIPDGDFEITARFTQEPDKSETYNCGIYLLPLHHSGERKHATDFRMETWRGDGGRCGIFSSNSWDAQDGEVFKRAEEYALKLIVKNGVAGLWLNGVQMRTTKNLSRLVPDWSNTLIGMGTGSRNNKNTVKLLEYTVRPLPAGAVFPEGTKFGKPENED